MFVQRLQDVFALFLEGLFFSFLDDLVSVFGPAGLEEPRNFVELVVTAASFSDVKTLVNALLDDLTNRR